MPTPYLTPDMLHNAPTGAPWNIIPFPKASSAEQLAEQTNICWRATGEVDGECNQPLRATLDTEQVHGPDYRLTIGPDGVGRAMLSRIPILSVVGAQVSPRAQIPRQWQVIPTNAVTPEANPIGVYGSSGFGQAGADGNAVLIAPGHVSWASGRNGCTVEMFYLNGWPHAGLTAAALVGATMLSVDDVTAFAGAQAFIYDGTATELVSVVSVAAAGSVTMPDGSTVPVGPGTVTLAGATGFAHTAGLVISALPQSVLWATALFAAAEAMTPGATAVTIQAIPGQQVSSGGGIGRLQASARRLLKPFRRVI